MTNGRIFFSFFWRTMPLSKRKSKKQMLSDATTSAQMHLNACICYETKTEYILNINITILLYIINHII